MNDAIVDRCMDELTGIRNELLLSDAEELSLEALSAVKLAMEVPSATMRIALRSVCVGAGFDLLGSDATADERGRSAARPPNQ